MRTLEEDLARAEQAHGHLCHGIALGVRMARMACAELGIGDPAGHRDLVVYVEMDRCVADAVASVTGVSLGRRRLKWVDYGKMAATFVDLASGRALRASPRADAPYGGPDDDPREFWTAYTDEDLFVLRPVEVEVPIYDRPGRSGAKAVCERCGEKIFDGRECVKEGRVLCRPCAGAAYYSSSDA